MLETKRLKDLQTHLITSDEWRESMKEHGVARNRFWDAANALVTKGMVVPPGSLVLGSPAKVVRPLTEAEQAALPGWAEKYIKVAAHHRRCGE